MMDVIKQKYTCIKNLSYEDTWDLRTWRKNNIHHNWKKNIYEFSIFYSLETVVTHTHTQTTKTTTDAYQPLLWKHPNIQEILKLLIPFCITSNSFIKDLCHQYCFLWHKRVFNLNIFLSIKQCNFLEEFYAYIKMLIHIHVQHNHINNKNETNDISSGHYAYQFNQNKT